MLFDCSVMVEYILDGRGLSRIYQLFYQILLLIDESVYLLAKYFVLGTFSLHGASHTFFCKVFFFYWRLPLKLMIFFNVCEKHVLRVIFERILLFNLIIEEETAQQTLFLHSSASPAALIVIRIRILLILKVIQ